MSIQHALIFIENMDTKKELRKACYACRTRSELLILLRGNGFSFTQDEFFDAVNILLFKCQTYEQADKVNQIKVWFSLFSD
jgi:predicted ribosomally synthesized peptide with nif11-like leader